MKKLTKTKIKTVIFDLDGTLLNTLTDLTLSVNYALDTLGLPARTEEEIRLMIGNGAEMLLKRAVGAGNYGLWEKAFVLQKEYYEKHGTKNTREYEGVTQMLSRLKDEGIYVAVFSNKSSVAAQSSTAHFFGEKVDLTVGTEDNEAKKPDPFGVKIALSSSGASQREAVFVGDSNVDIETAANAGIKCISVTWGFRDKAFLKAAGAKYFADRPSDVTDMLL